MAARRKAFRIENFQHGAEMASTEALAQSSEIIREIRTLRQLMEPQGTLPARLIEAFRKELGDAQSMKSELEAVQEAIERTKHEIATVHTTGFKGAQMTRVTGELDAIVQGTLDATDAILTAAEKIDRDAQILEASC